MDHVQVGLGPDDVLIAAVCHGCHAQRWYHGDQELSAGDALGLALMRDLREGGLVTR
jgi:hypothetical protein